MHFIRLDHLLCFSFIVAVLRRLFMRSHDFTSRHLIDRVGAQKDFTFSRSKSILRLHFIGSNRMKYTFFCFSFANAFFRSIWMCERDEKSSKIYELVWNTKHSLVHSMKMWEDAHRRDLVEIEINKNQIENYSLIRYLHHFDIRRSFDSQTNRKANKTKHENKKKKKNEMFWFDFNCRLRTETDENMFEFRSQSFILFYPKFILNRF